MNPPYSSQKWTNWFLVCGRFVCVCVFVYCSVVQPRQQVEQQVVTSKSFESHECKPAILLADFDFVDNNNASLNCCNYIVMSPIFKLLSLECVAKHLAISAHQSCSKQ